uniref:Mucin-22-like n=1 Tax=Haemonchus contortus TaxID=6289 RepID=A0A7I4YIV6_HAECO
MLAKAAVAKAKKTEMDDCMRNLTVEKERSDDTTLLTTGSAATPQPSSIYSSTITDKPTSLGADKSTTTGVGTTMLTSSSATTPQPSLIYSSTITSKPTSVRVKESTNTGNHHVKTVMASSSPTRAVESSKILSNLTEAEQSTTGTVEGGRPTGTVSTSTRRLPSNTRPVESSKAEHPVTENIDRATVIRTTGPMSQTTTLYSAQVPSKSTVLEQEQATTYVIAASVVKSSQTTPHTAFTHSVSFTKMYTTFEGAKISTTSENAETSQLATSTIVREKGATATTTLSSPRSVKSFESPSVRLSSVHKYSTMRKSTKLEKAGNTNTSTDIALLTASFATTHESPTVQERSASSKLTSLEAAKNTTTSTDTTMLNTSFASTHESSTILKTSAINKLTTLESTKEYILQGFIYSLGTGATMTTRRGETVENSSPVHGATTTKKYNTTLEESTVNTETSTSTRRTETMSNDTETTTSKPAERATMSTDSTVPTTSFSTTHASSTISEASATSKSSSLRAGESNTANTDTTMLTASSTTTSQSSTIYATGAISKSTPLDSAKSATTSEHQPTTASLLSSYRSVSSFENLQDLKEAKQATTRVTTMNTSYKTSSQSPIVRRTGITEDLASLESASNSSTKNYLTTNMTSISSYHSVSSTENPPEMKRDVGTTYKTEPQSFSAYTAIATHKSTTMQPSTAASKGTDAGEYHAITGTSSQFVTPITNATEKEAAATTDATTVITSSKAMQRSSPLSDASTGKKSTTLVRNTTTRGPTDRISWFLNKIVSQGSTYIGETGRQLATRIKEHLASMRRGSLMTALGRHKIEEHNGNSFEIKCTILAQETEISARKALEAFWIFQRSPKMNGRDECPSITNDLLPYIPHCDL